MSIQTHHRVCNFCEAMCGVTVVYDPQAKGDKQVSVKPDTLDPFSRGSMCPKAPVLGPLHFDKNRLKYPCLLYTSPSPRDKRQSRMPSSA